MVSWMGMSESASSREARGIGTGDSVSTGGQTGTSSCAGIGGQVLASGCGSTRRFVATGRKFLLAPLSTWHSGSSDIHRS